ncbi:transposase [Microcoleus sp. BROC3]
MEVAGYFEQITNNGIFEGINNKIKLLKGSGFGLINYHNFEMPAWLFWHFLIIFSILSTEKPLCLYQRPSKKFRRSIKSIRQQKLRIGQS